MPTQLNQSASRDQSPLAVVRPADRLIVALDFPDATTALNLIDQLEGATRWFKVGLELYISSGNSLIAELRRRDCGIFLDLKLHDIPNTVASAVRAATRLDVQMLTVHAGGGADMLSAAVEAANGTPLALLGVTVLTSMDEARLEETGVQGGVAAQVERLATLAMNAGMQGLVCSPGEVGNLRSRLPRQPLLVIPGVRPAGSEVGDQRRVATPQAAIHAGADYLVVGRPITRDANPGKAARAVIEEISAALN